MVTITAGDYTVSKTIHEEDFLSFKNNNQETGADSIAYLYMKDLKEKYERKITFEPAVNEQVDCIKIANISFAFDNDDMIELLEKRGTAICNNKEEEKVKIEKKIDELHKSKSEELSRPVKAFITFETQEGYERAIRYKENGRKTLKPAVEPTNIIWENTHFTKTAKFTRTLVVIGIIVILMVLAFFLFILIKRGLVNNSRKYLSLNCDEFNENIPSDDTRLKYGISDYYGFYESTTETKMTGALQ